MKYNSTLQPKLIESLLLKIELSLDGGGMGETEGRNVPCFG